MPSWYKIEIFTILYRQKLFSSYLNEYVERNVDYMGKVINVCGLYCLTT